MPTLYTTWTIFAILSENCPIPISVLIEIKLFQNVVQIKSTQTNPHKLDKLKFIPKPLSSGKQAGPAVSQKCKTSFYPRCQNGS